MRLQWDSLSASGKDKVWFSLLPLASPVSPSARMSHFVLFHWMILHIFIAHTVSEVVRGTAGQPVTLPCFYKVTRPKDVSNMCWGRGPCPNSKCNTKILYTSGSKVAFKISQRYNLHGSISSGDVSLTIGAVKAQDAGVYCCRVEIPGLFNDIKRNIRLEVARAPPATTTTSTTTTAATTTTTTTITTRKASVSPEHFTETTFSPQATSDFQPASETAVLLTASTPPPETIDPESPAATTGEATAPPATAGTENDIFPVTMVETSSTSDFPTTSQADDVTTEDVIFCSTLPGNTEVTTEFQGTLPAAEEAATSAMMEEMSVMEVSANSNGHAGKLEAGGDKLKLPFPRSGILIACVIAGSILLILLILLAWKRKQAKKLIVKSVGPPEETEKVFSGAEGENNIFSL